MESGTITTAVVADLDNVRLAKPVHYIDKLVVVIAFPLSVRIQKRIPDFSRNVERLSGLGFLESISHQVPIPNPAKFPYS
jgi:hypothetical protein